MEYCAVVKREEEGEGERLLCANGRDSFMKRKKKQGVKKNMFLIYS